MEAKYDNINNDTDTEQTLSDEQHVRLVNLLFKEMADKTCRDLDLPRLISDWPRSNTTPGVPFLSRVEFKRMMDQLAESPWIERMSFRGCYLTLADLETLQKRLMKACPKLQALDLSNNRLTDDAMPVISLFLAAHSSIRHVDLSFNQFSPEGCKAFAATLQ